MSKILIVDDDLTMTGLLEALMVMEGHQPIVVNDSRKAIEIAASTNPDLITLDLMMPGMSGFELCALLRSDPHLSTIPILIVSAKDDLESRNKAAQLGVKEYITKPFDVEVLMERIRTLANSR